MADILIKGMKMPKNCKECPCSTWALDEPFFFCVLGQEVSCEYDTRGKGCPLVEVKPHGRCIDADRLADDFRAWLVTTSPCMQKSVADAMVETVRTAARIAPTMLEASDNICLADDDHSYEMQSDMRDYCERYEPTYNPEDGSL